MRDLVRRLSVGCLFFIGLFGLAQGQQPSGPGAIAPVAPANEQQDEIEAFTAAFTATVRAALLNDKCKVLSIKEAERIGFFGVTILEVIRGDIGATAANQIIDEGQAWAEAKSCDPAATMTIQNGFRAGQQAMESRLGATTVDGIDFYQLVAAELLIRKCRLFQTEQFNGKDVATHLAELETAIAETAVKLEPSEAAEIKARTTIKFDSSPDACGLRASIVAMIGLVKSEFVRKSSHR